MWLENYIKLIYILYIISISVCIKRVATKICGNF